MKEPILYKIVRPILVIWFRITYKPTFINKEVIPKKGRVILAGSHISQLDGFMLGASTKRPVRFIAKSELFKGIGKYFFTACGLVPVNRNIKDTSVMPAVTNLLNQESLIGIFPEGTVNRTNEVLLPFKTGSIRMAIETNSPIIPFAIIGSYKEKVKIVFGDLYYLKTDNVEKENEILRNKVKNIIKKESDEL